MYQAKGSGRDKFLLYKPEMESPPQHEGIDRRLGSVNQQ